MIKFYSPMRTKRVVRRASSILSSSTHSDDTELTQDLNSDESGRTIEDESQGGDHQDEGLVPRLPQTQTRLVAPLHRKELQLGKLLGRGAFSEVYEVSGIKLLEAKKKNAKDKVCSGHEQVLRQNFRNSLLQEQEDEDGVVVPKYAVKHLSRKLTRKPKQFYEAALDLSREAALMRSLDHPHILKARASTFGGTEVFAETGRFDSFFIVCDHLSDSLTQRIQQWKSDPVYQEMGRLPKLIMKTQYASQLASALDYLHDRRIIFRDLKPDNVGFLSSARDTLQLFDFGICRALPPSTKKTPSNTTPRTFHPLRGGGGPVQEDEEETYLMSLAGTVRYLSPEVLSNGRYNLKADVHSYAMVCYEMYSEVKPYQHLRLMACFQEFVCRSRVRPNVHQLHLPPALECLITGAWCPELAERLSMKDVCEVLPGILHELEGGMKGRQVDC